ncbi:hypothetical protein [Nocardioides sp. SYSU D00065]|uniref:hypothetical protein n=1 Tax=Nocardioides sp. SYSU D00065 TaxID=2817378 RepID=UPI001B343CEE|nr:hypothetical protein [Nocardioides sp. SYSU D00065]
MSTDLRSALSLVADGPTPGAAHTDPSAGPAADLDRARASARARARRRSRLAATGATAAVMTVLLAVTLDEAPGGSGPGDAPAAVTAAQVRLVAGPLDVAPYVFDRVPDGWVVQGQRPMSVTIVPPDGSVSDHPDDFRGKLVILFDRNGLYGTPTTYDGRSFHVSRGDGYTTVSTRTTDAEPAGFVRVQYPDDTGWSDAQMLEFLDGVRVTSLAEPGLG